MLFGLLLAYIINYAFYFTSGSVQWRFPLLFQLVFAIYILAATPWLPDSPRWLLRHEKSPDRGIAVLAKLRNTTPDNAAVRAEADDILQVIALEAESEGSWMDLVRDGGLKTNKRFMLALGIQCQYLFSVERNLTDRSQSCNSCRASTLSLTTHQLFSKAVSACPVGCL